MGVVIVHMRGAWVEDVCRKVRKRVKNAATLPFLLIKHLRLGRPCYTGIYLIEYGSSFFIVS